MARCRRHKREPGAEFHVGVKKSNRVNSLVSLRRHNAQRNDFCGIKDGIYVMAELDEAQNPRSGRRGQCLKPNSCSEPHRTSFAGLVSCTSTNSPILSIRDSLLAESAHLLRLDLLILLPVVLATTTNTLGVRETIVGAYFQKYVV